MHPADCRCVRCLVDRSSFGTPEAKAARESVSDEQVARVVARAKELDVTADRDVEAVARRWHQGSDHAADGTPFGGGLCNCERLARDRLLPLIREREAAAWERALREAADKWQTGAWTALTEPIKAERQAQRIIGAAQVVLDWLRDRAAANPYAGSEGA